jgi:Na+/melibiose symporter-like transporter
VLAGLVPLIGRGVDAITDPLMGRLSDRTRWSSGRRRPFFLLGAIPYGLSFLLLWMDPPFVSQAARFAYYAAAYSFFSLTLTVLYVPYLALVPEMATGYDERTSLNAYRSAVGSLGMLAAISLRLVAEALGGESADFATAAALYALLLTLPWLAVYWVTFEPERAPPALERRPLFEGVVDVARQRSFRHLCVIYLLGRMAMDIAGAMLILYSTFWLGRIDDFEVVMLLFFGGLLLSYPLAVRLAAHRDKARLYAAGAVLWALVSASQWIVQPDWPRWVFIAFVPLITPGFAIVDLMPWSMIGEVADEGELDSGERRDGLYNGVLSFVRKFGGAIGLFLVLGLLDVMGFVEGREVQSETVRQSIRAISAFGPVLPLLGGALPALRYPIGRTAHARTRAALDARGSLRGPNE